MRGNPTRPGITSANIRSIPAGAGQPHTGFPVLSFRRVYPRGCGATALSGRGDTRRTGLSPRVRGNRSQAARKGLWERSIPAGAGQPSGKHGRACEEEVYPRGCGATYASDCDRHRLRGLSPRVRGNHFPSLISHSSSRSIPAGAGQPKKQAKSIPRKKVYPRGCGATQQGPA